MIRMMAMVLAGAVLLQACSLVTRRTPQEKYCRAALAFLAKQGPSYSIDDTSSTVRDLDQERVTAVTITYDQGPATRLMTCFFRTGRSAPIRINYRGKPLSGSQLRQVDAAARES